MGSIEKTIQKMLGDFIKILDKIEMDKHITEQKPLNDLISLERKIGAYKRQKLAKYEEFKSGEISREVFIQNKLEIESLIDKTEMQIQEIEKQSKNNKASGLYSKLNVFIPFENPTEEMINSLVEKILVDREGKIKIYWTFKSPI